ncbi:MAG: hypothetical protein SGI99_00685 [Pseudomonadota bacterium]|nr:hypothetical protein [Pseudomonadota bacterium]
MNARALLMVILGYGSGASVAGQYEFASPAVAGSPGGQTAPLLFVGFRGDGETTDTQVEFTYNATRFTAQLTARNGALCLLPAAGRVRIISPGSGSPLTSTLVRYCEIGFTIAPATPGGSHDFALDNSAIECSGLVGPSPSCTAPTGVGVIRVGPNSPQAQFNYQPAANSTIVLAQGVGEISAEFVAGGFGAAIELHDCQLAAQVGASFGPVLSAPQPLAFVSNLTGSGLLGMSCTQQLTDTTAQLACTETRNGTLQFARSWSLLCPALPPILIMENGFESPLPPTAS